MKLDLHIDLETYSSVDISCGVDKYVESPDFEILLLAYSIGGQKVKVLDISQIKGIPQYFKELMESADYVKKAHNANFEIACLRRYGLRINRAEWRCSMVAGAYLGLPLALGKVAEVLQLDEQKDTKGKALISYFCKPCKPTARNGMRTRNLPQHDPAKWQEFKEYCGQDVVTETAIFDYCERVRPVPSFVWDEWILDSEINDTGVLIDSEFVDSAIEAFEQAQEETFAKMRKYGIDNPKSVAQIKAYIIKETGETTESLARAELAESLAKGFFTEDVEKLLRLRVQASNTSVAKLNKIKDYLQNDGRIRGQFQFYGANRTGREAGRGVQLQNLKRTYSEPKLGMYRDTVKYGLANEFFTDTGEVISKLVRTAFIAGKGRKLLSVDFSAIEARVLAWLAGETWVLDVFKTHGKIYEATASKMFNVPLESVTKGSDMRAKGKVASLALGYQGASGALITMGALREGLTEDELPAIVRTYRQANPAIVKFWRDVELYAKTAIEKRKSVTLKLMYTQITFQYSNGYLFIVLPSGRSLSYFGARANGGKLTYFGLDQVKKQWSKTDTYGGKLVENITQAVARDLLFDCLLKLSDSIELLQISAKIVMHIHDEVVIDCGQNLSVTLLDTATELMSHAPNWANGLPLKGEGYISDYYKKD